MEINIEMNGKVAVLKCSGNLDADTVALFKKRAVELFEGGVNRFLIDATDVTFIDSMGLGAMISLLRRVREKKGDVKIFGLNKEVHDIFEITRLNKLFDICKNENEAVKKFV